MKTPPEYAQEAVNDFGTSREISIEDAFKMAERVATSVMEDLQSRLRRMLEDGEDEVS